MSERGATRYQRKRKIAEEKELETTTPAGQWLLANAIEPLAEALADWIKLAKARPGRCHRAVSYYEMLPLDLTAALVARSVLDSISTAKKMTRCCMQAATILEDEVRFRAVAASDRGLWRELYERTKEYGGYATKRRHIVHGMNKAGHAFEAWPQPDKLQVGVVALDLMASSTGLIEIHTRMTMFGTRRTEVVATDSAMRWLKECHAKSEILTPMYLPCVEAPKDWETPVSGGFHTDSLHKRALVKTSDLQYLTEVQELEMPRVYDSVNTLQRTQFVVNEKVADTMRHCWENNLDVGKLPLKDDEVVPDRPEDIATNAEARKVWRRSAAAIHDRNAQTRAERLAVAKVLNLADKFAGERLSYVAQLDWRGRVYPTAYHLHPQGPDWVKSLLLFAEGDPLSTPDAVRWFKVAGANFMGMTKHTFAERVAWVDEQHDTIIHVATDPMEHRAWWEVGDDPWCLLAWAIEYKGWADDPAGFHSRIPIPQDATQSGVQIMSLLLRDEVGAVATNCTPSDRPQDLYGAVADSVVRILEGREDDEIARMWLEFGVDRSCTKRPVMVRPYNGGLYSALRYVREWALGKGGLPVTDDFSACFYLAKTIWEAMDEVMSGTQKTMEWLGKVSDICVKHGLPVRWTTPSGFPVKQTYWSTKLRSVKTMIGDTLRKHSLREDTDKLDARRMRNGLAPNYIHSLDASALMETVLLAKQAGVTQFALVHDSFATTAFWSESLAQSIREAYLRIFRDDVLAGFKREVELYLPAGEGLPPLPDYGNLDIELVASSPYFFN